jgi:hypothetical protein
MDTHDEEIWLVQIGHATRAMTLDELDAAFNDGTINEDTFVRRDGAAKWVRLRDELGESEPAPAPAPAPVYQYQAPVPVLSPTPAPVVYQQYNSVRPVVSEIDMDELDLDSPFAKKSGKGKFVAIGLAAAAMIGGLAFGATKLKNAPVADVNASVVQAVQAPQAVTPPPVVETAAPVVAKPVLNDDQKKALADKDNKFSQKQDALKKARANQIVPKRGKTQPPPFSKSGNAYDPLNAKL